MSPSGNFTFMSAATKNIVQFSDRTNHCPKNMPEGNLRNTESESPLGKELDCRDIEFFLPWALTIRILLYVLH